MRQLALSIVLVAACSSHDQAKRIATAPHDAQAQRVIPPPTGNVRALPPHAIRADGVGPYLLGDPINELLHSMPGGPILLRFDIPGLVRTGVVRAEDDKLIVGGEPGATTTFVAVVGDEEIARTESGIHVGSTRTELAKATAQALEDPGSPTDVAQTMAARIAEPFRARDPRLVAEALPNVLALFDGTADTSKLQAFLVTPDAPPPAAPPGPACTRPVPDPGAAAPTTFGLCLSTLGELVEVADDSLTVKTGDGARTLATLRITDLAFAAPLRALEDGRDDLVVVTHSSTPAEQRWGVVAYRIEAGKLVRVAEAEPAFTLTDQETRWVGVPVRDVDLYLQLASRADGIEVGGVLVTLSGGTVRDLAPITPLVMPRGHGIAKPVPSDGVNSGGSAVPGSSATASAPPGDAEGAIPGVDSESGSAAGSARPEPEHTGSGSGRAGGRSEGPPTPRKGSGTALRPTPP